MGECRTILLIFGSWKKIKWKKHYQKKESPWNFVTKTNTCVRECVSVWVSLDNTFSICWLLYVRFGFSSIQRVCVCVIQCIRVWSKIMDSGRVGRKEGSKHGTGDRITCTHIARLKRLAERLMPILGRMMRWLKNIGLVLKEDIFLNNWIRNTLNWNMIR